MRITYEDRLNIGSIDSEILAIKPEFTFEYAWFLVTNASAEYVESHDLGVYNKLMTEDMVTEVIEYYNNYTFKGEIPPYNPLTEGIVDDEIVVIDGKKYQQYKVAPLSAEEALRKYKETVPSSITLRQAKLALHYNELLEIVNLAIADSGDVVLQIEWDNASVIQRDWTSLKTMADSLGITERELDELFILGASL